MRFWGRLALNQRILTISKPYVAQIYRGKLAALVNDHHFDAGLICPPNWGGSAWESSSIAEPINIQRVPILLNGHNHLHVYRGLKKAVQRYAPDILNVEEEHYSLVTWQALQIAKSLKVPMTFYTWQNIYKSYPPPFSWIERAVFGYCKSAFAGNREAAQVLQQKGYRGQITVVPQMGTDPEVFKYLPPQAPERTLAKQSLQLDQQRFWLGFVGRIVEEKGIQTVLKALQGFSAQDQLGFLIVGSGPYLQQIKAQAHQLGVLPLCVFHEQVPSHKMPQYMHAIDALILPSLTRKNWKEQFGRVLVEAMASGTSVIGSSSGEIPQVIADCGWIFAEEDVAQLKSAVQILLTDLDQRIVRATKARERVLAEFTHKAVANKFAKVFRQLLVP